MQARTIQAIAAAVALTGVAVGGRLLPSLQDQTEDAGLRYTSEPVDGAPPWVAIGTTIGSLRGLVVNILWIKVQYMKERGLYFEVMDDADLITKLQPRFAQVWAFHGHNMAYNISVATHTQAERWNWVNNGIRLVRNEGIRHNPTTLDLYKELAFWFAHKIEGWSDDGHLYYKREFAREWHYLLGRPPGEVDRRVEWMRVVDDAPETLDEAESRTPGVKALIERFDESMGPFGEAMYYEPTGAWLLRYGEWQAVAERSEVAQVLGIEQRMRQTSAVFAAFDSIAKDPEVADQWATLVSYTRKKVLRDEYNMEPAFMVDLMEEFGPIDWRSGYAHALYWARRGEFFAGASASDQLSVTVSINNDRQQLQALQGLARFGRITFDPFSTELPSRFAEPRFVDAIDETFEHYYQKHFYTRGGGSDTFVAFLENFMSSAVRESYRSGEFARAQQLLDKLDERFGAGAKDGMNNFIYSAPLDVFVRDQIRDEYTHQVHLAPSEALASMYYAYRVGVGQGREEVWENALVFVRQVIALFTENMYNDYVNKFGEARMADMMQDLSRIRRTSFQNVMTDPGIPLEERAVIWNRVDEFDNTVRAWVYDDIAGELTRQLQNHPLGQRYLTDQLFPAPANLASLRPQIAQAKQAREQRIQAAKERAQIQTR